MYGVYLVEAASLRGLRSLCWPAPPLVCRRDAQARCCCQPTAYASIRAFAHHLDLWVCAGAACSRQDRVPACEKSCGELRHTCRTSGFTWLCKIDIKDHAACRDMKMIVILLPRRIFEVKDSADVEVMKAMDEAH